VRKPYAKQIDLEATQLLEKLDLYRAPVDIKAVAEGLGATLVYAELDDVVSGFLLRENKTTTIAVNARHHPNRQRFTIAHECGHLFLHARQENRLWVDKQTTLFYRDAASSSGEQREEIQANQFAAGLLMPEGLLMSQVNDETSESDVMKLAMRFQVSEQAMLWRLGSLDVLEMS
jgi:Zn-dependent peptidase ImmA (M78 family)